MCNKCKENMLNTMASSAQSGSFQTLSSAFPVENFPFIIEGCHRWEDEMFETIGPAHLDANGSIYGLREVFISMRMWASLDILERYLAIGDQGCWDKTVRTDLSELMTSDLSY